MPLIRDVPSFLGALTRISETRAATSAFDGRLLRPNDPDLDELGDDPDEDSDPDVDVDEDDEDDDEDVLDPEFDDDEVPDDDIAPPRVPKGPR